MNEFVSALNQLERITNRLLSIFTQANQPRHQQNQQISGLDDSMEGGSDGPTEDVKPCADDVVLTPVRYETTEFEAYDFNELIATNQRRMKMESEQNSGQVD